MDGLRFALAYAARNLRRAGSRSLFAAFCVAVGVAAVVGMQLLALNISAAVDRAPKEANGGDIAIEPITTPFQPADIAKVEALRRRGIIAAYTMTLGNQAKAQYGALITIINVRGIQPDKYPLYGAFLATQPAVPVRDLLRGPHDAVVTSDLFDRLHLAIGDVVRLTNPVTEHVTIRGVISPGGLFQGDFGIGGSIYQPLPGLLAADPEAHQGTEQIVADKLYVRTRDDARTGPALTALKGALGPFFRFTTAADVARQAATDTARLQQLLLAAGLLALVIGGIGIVNTMLVSVGRRTKEIAVLKALGLKGRQVVGLFLVEALCLGLVGSALGLLGGIGLSALITLLARYLGAEVSWALRPSPLGVGAALGVAASAVFGFLPVLRAGHTRPIGVLRDEDAPLPRIGWPLTGLVTVLLTGGMGIAVGVALRNLILGLILAYGLVALFLLCSLIFLGVVVVASRGPSFGLVGLKLALRNLSRQKRRVSSTLVALCIGVLAVGTVVVLAQNVKTHLDSLFQRDWGFNVVAFTPSAGGQEAQAVTLARRRPGLQRLERGLLVADLRITSINGRPADQVVEQGLGKLGRDLFALQSLDGRDLRVAKLGLKVLKGGRTLGPADEGTGNVLVPDELAAPLGLRVGSTLQYSVLGSGGFTLRVVGLIDPTSIVPVFGNGLVASASFLRPYATQSFGSFNVLYLQYAADQTADAASALNRDLPQVYAFDINALVPVFDRILEKATVFPIVLAALSLFAGGVIIANTVALAVLERRREIGVMKALGARSGAILRLLLLESGIVGLLGGALGMAMAIIATIVLDNETLNIPTSISALAVLALIALAVLLALAASIISALPASREKPLIVLRYE